jgi:hypothetical protein
VGFVVYKARIRIELRTKIEILSISSVKTGVATADII